jgi:hypothetical protein
LNTVSEITSQFLERSGAQVAINANVLLRRLSGEQNRDWLGRSNAALLISQSNAASIMTTADMSLTNFYNAIAGSAIIVQNGINMGALSPNEGDPANPNPRSDVGLSQYGRFF